MGGGAPMPGMPMAPGMMAGPGMNAPPGMAPPGMMRPGMPGMPGRFTDVHLLSALFTFECTKGNTGGRALALFQGAYTYIHVGCIPANMQYPRIARMRSDVSLES
jgi:hypothetical protein